jgi:RNase P subunit RPR2
VTETQQSATELTEAQTNGQACRGCGSTEAPLHPDKTITTRVATGVVRDTVTVVCTPCLVTR